jgi:hypothetical protein
MIMLTLLFTALLVLLVGKVLLQRLGWPTSVAAAARWGIVLLGFALVFATLPELIRMSAAGLGRVDILPTIGLADLIPVLLVLGLAILGYVGWTRGEVERERQARVREHARTMPRRPALPPPPAGDPAAPGVPHFQPVGQGHGAPAEGEGPRA